ncbi:hypothetical protein PYW08_016297 [Mythimna loreyi]|uniref:Uncharacterized protein n=1 Tax=Mythimna loreyi TaxID=667449 RepID=A0ACC2QXS8_9NEOP|nr:hypothetical protein PYW08_016297 [Mythimna loreyi]
MADGYCRPMLLSLSTRGIGLNLCSFYANAIRHSRRNELPDINAVYRAMLAIVETKLDNLGSPPRYNDFAYVTSSYKLTNLIGHMTFWVPTSLQRIIDAIGITETEDEGIYFPVMSENTIDDNLNFVPRPENIHLSNLRETVLALADSNDSVAAVSYRTKFYQNNPIPAAEWDQNHTLMNAAKIMPDQYDYDKDLRNDIKTLNSLQQITRTLEKINLKKVTFSNATGILMSSKMSGLRAPDLRPNETLIDYYCHANPEKDVQNFRSLFNLSDDIKMQGATMLLGEQPIIDDCPQHSVYALRSESLNPFPFQHSYKNSCWQQYFNNSYI